jgi:broad specificity phosphatase PhoE
MINTNKQNFPIAKAEINPNCLPKEDTDRDSLSSDFNFKLDSFVSSGQTDAQHNSTIAQKNEIDKNQLHTEDNSSEKTTTQPVCCIAKLKKPNTESALDVVNFTLSGPTGTALKSNKPLKIIIVRHEMTEFNKEGRLQGHIDVPLSEEGLKRALNTSKILIEHLKNTHIQAIYSSDFIRACQTSAPFIESLDEIGITPPVYYDSKLEEIDFGIWDGKNPKEIQNESGEPLFEQWQKVPRSVTPRQGEQIDKFYNRIMLEFGKIIKENFDKVYHQDKPRAVVIFTHGGVMSAVVNNIRGHNPGNILQLKFPNGGAFEIEYKDGKFTENGQIG